MLMLDHHLGSGAVGIYNTAAPLARFIPVFMVVFTTIYDPIVTGLYAEGRVSEIERFYRSVTK